VRSFKTFFGFKRVAPIILLIFAAYCIKRRTQIEKKDFITGNTEVLQKEGSFLPNLSIMDVLFNEGTRALSYLEKQKL